jgi:alkaline phosphatase D
MATIIGFIWYSCPFNPAVAESATITINRLNTQDAVTGQKKSTFSQGEAVLYRMKVTVEGEPSTKYWAIISGRTFYPPEGRTKEWIDQFASRDRFRFLTDALGKKTKRLKFTGRIPLEASPFTEVKAKAKIKLEKNGILLDRAKKNRRRIYIEGIDLGCFTPPGCQPTSPQNAHVVAGDCLNEGECYDCDPGHIWNGSQCIAGDIPLSSDEGFENTGYEESDWIEEKSVDSSINADAMLPDGLLPPTRDDNSQCLRISSDGSLLNSNAYIQKSLTSETGNTFLRFYVYVASQDLADGESYTVVKATDGSASLIYEIDLVKDIERGNLLNWHYKYFSEGQYQTVKILENNARAGMTGCWFMIEAIYDANNGNYGFKVNDRLIKQGYLNSPYKTEITTFQFGKVGGVDKPVDLYFDQIAIQTGDQATWIGAERGAYLINGPVFSNVTDSSVTVWSRTARTDAEIKVKYGRQADLSDASISSGITVGKETDYSDFATLSGLAADTTYYFDILVDNMSQLGPPYPQCRTFPPEGVSRDFVFAFGGDSHYPGPSKVFSQVLIYSPLFFIHGGDFGATRQTLYPFLSEARAKERANLSARNSEMALNIHRRMGFFSTWDDHDFCGDNSDRTSEGRETAMQVWQEYRRPNTLLENPGNGVWYSFRCADAELFVLDTRSQRDPTEDNNRSMLDGFNIGLNNQLDWLVQGVNDSSATWKFIVTSVPFNDTLSGGDRWGGFDPNDMERDYIVNNITAKNVIMLSADRHLSGIDSGIYSDFPELMASPLSGNFTPDALGSWSEGINLMEYQFGLITVGSDAVLLEVINEDGQERLHLSVPRY